MQSILPIADTAQERAQLIHPPLFCLSSVNSAEVDAEQAQRRSRGITSRNAWRDARPVPRRVLRRLPAASCSTTAGRVASRRRTMSGSTGIDDARERVEPVESAEVDVIREQTKPHV